MKKFYFVVSNWKKTQPASMLSVSSKVSQQMDGNKFFPDPAVAIPDMQAKEERLQTAYNNRGEGKLARRELKEASDDMDMALKTQSFYVNNAAMGNLLILETSGFAISKINPTKSVIPAMPTNVKMESSNGNVTLIAKKPKGAASLCWIVYYGDVLNTVVIQNNMISVPAGVSAQIINAGKGRELITSLEPGTRVSVQVLAQNAAGCSALTQPTSIYVNK